MFDNLHESLVLVVSSVNYHESISISPEIVYFSGVIILINGEFKVALSTYIMSGDRETYYKLIGN